MGMVLGEQGYKEQMLSVILPYNKERENDTYIERVKGEKIHLAMYKADQPKAAVVISHGYTESIVKYQEVIYYFLTNGYHVYMSEHCGHGRSYRLNQDKSLVVIDTYERYVQDLSCVAHLCKDAYPDLPIYLYAHSMGGGIGAVLIGKEPRLFNKVVLTSPMIRPETGGIPWIVGKCVTKFMILTGHKYDYALGQKPWTGEMDFAGGCTTSEPRYVYYEELRQKDSNLQTCACSYSWLGEAARINDYLQNKGWKNVAAPVLLMQAEDETLVSKPEQQKFIRKIVANGKTTAELIPVPGTKHEIFNATAEVQESYWEKVFAFLA